MKGPLLEAVGVGKRYAADVIALDGFDLAVEEGDFVTLIGPSGCGKTTFLRMAAGFETPTAGEVRFRGEPVAGADVERAVLFQDVRLFPFLTLGDNLRFGTRARGVGVPTLLDELVERFELEPHLDRFPHALSLGTQQKAALARVLANEPRLLLCDEPFSSLDDRSRVDLHDALKGAWETRRMTVLFVTHHVREAVSLSQRVVVLTARPGRIKAVVDVASDGEASDLLSRTREVSRLLQGDSGSGA